MGSNGHLSNPDLTNLYKQSRDQRLSGAPASFIAPTFLNGYPMIQVVNKYKHTPTENDCYIGRGSPFGNPFSWLPGTLEQFRVADRAEAIQKYAKHLEWAVMNDPVIHEGMNLLCMKALRDEPINLVCFCKPQGCHGDVIKRHIEETLQRIKELE